MINEKINILGIDILTLDKQEIENKLVGFLHSNQANLIITANPEIILQAQADEEYFYIINRYSQLVIADGMGLKLAALSQGINLYRYPGVELTEFLLQKAEVENHKVGILLWQDGLTNCQEVEKMIKKKYPKLNYLCLAIERSIYQELDKRLDEFSPAIIFVTLGAPWQEKFIFHQLLRKNYLKISIGVGGVFDFFCNKIKRAPKALRMLGLEWIWRLLQQPRRIKRIYQATFIFSLKYLQWRFILPFLYRPNVVCLLYKKEGEKYKILLVRRSDLEEDHWQLPQGGLDKLSIAQAGRKELEEETHALNFKTIATFSNLYKYEFGSRGEQLSYVVAGKKHCGYRGQQQSLYIAEFTGQDQEIKVNYWEHNGWQWVDSENFLTAVHPIRRTGCKIYFDKFKEVAMSS
ncbi:MAG: WecB/TagA/CpsF family glycosyltransferase [Candidatus Falkowbacteria bacterium]|nr:WecB/TagA/CpsF family glycosyltransferase [Candidatus Falkowbacteria bacterium]